MGPFREHIGGQRQPPNFCLARGQYPFDSQPPHLDYQLSILHCDSTFGPAYGTVGTVAKFSELEVVPRVLCCFTR